VRVWLIVLLAGCGRFAFDPGSDGGATPDVSLPSDLVLYYPMDEIAPGNSLEDKTPYGHLAVCWITCPPLEPGIKGMALHLDGVQDYVEVLPAPDIDALTTYTVAFWARVDAQTNAAGCMIGKVFGTADANSFQICMTMATQQVFTSGWDGAMNDDFYVGYYLDASWHHLAITYDGTLERLYTDGAFWKMRVRPLYFDTHELVIGTDYDNSAPFAHFGGWLDDVRIYNRALAPAEIMALAQ